MKQLTLLLCLFSFIAHAKQKPNIIFILADDLGYSDLGCAGSDLYLTPNIDGLAKEAMYFTYAGSSHPTCQPSRLSLQTGKYPARLGCVSHAALGGVKGGPIQIPKEEVTIGSALQMSGYTTAHIGKWHIGMGENTPAKRGYDVDIASNDFCCPVTYFYPYNKPSHKQNKLGAVPDLSGYNKEYHLTEALASEAEKYILSSNSSQPFYLNLCFYAVHTPIEAEKDKIEKYKKLVDKDNLHKNPTYAALVEHQDDAVGKVLAAIKKKGIEENTIVIFMSDNGGEIGMGITNNFPLKEGKGSQYEGGYRVPMIVKWPGVTLPGSTTEERVMGFDLYPTILSMAGAKGDKQHNKTVDGIDLSSLLKHPTKKLKNRDIHFLRYLSLVHYKPSNLIESKRPCASIIKDGWKLMEFMPLPTKSAYFRLYHLAEDPSELNDLASFMPDKVAQLQKAMMKWRKEVDAPFYDMEGFYGK